MVRLSLRVQGCHNRRMKVTIPEQLKTDVPLTYFGKILSATPVVMAVVATMLAGLASSEMTRAQYDRSLGAQQQSKAGDQWSFFQAKRLRGAVQQNTVDLLESTTALHPFGNARLTGAVQLLSSQPGSSPAVQAEQEKIESELKALAGTPTGQQALDCLEKGSAPALDRAAAVDPRIQAALGALANLRPDSEMAQLLSQVSNGLLEQTVSAAQDRAQAFDLATTPINKTIDQFDGLLARLLALGQKAPAHFETTSLSATPSPSDASSASVFELNRDFTAARLRYAAVRYEVEARLNQAIANLYELQVRKSNISAVHHHLRSQRFFFGMLGAQMGVIISTLALAARNRNLLWSLAAGAGLIAVAFAIYVYLYV